KWGNSRDAPRILKFKNSDCVPRILPFPAHIPLSTFSSGSLRLRHRWGRRSRNHFCRGNRRDRVFEDWLFLIVCFQDHRVLVESLNLPYQFYTADQKNGDWGFVSADSVQVNVLDILGRRFVFHRNSLKSGKRFNKLMDHVLNLIAVSGSIKPSNVRLLSKPCHLTFRISSRISLNYTNRFFVRDTGIDMCDNVPIPDRLKRLGTGWNTLSQQLTDLLDQTCGEHLADTIIDSPVEFFAGRI